MSKKYFLTNIKLLCKIKKINIYFSKHSEVIINFYIIGKEIYVRKVFLSCLIGSVAALFSFLALSNCALYAKDTNLDIQGDSYHQSFAPYDTADILQNFNGVKKPEKVVTVKVKEIITYEVPVDESKLNSNSLGINDLEINDIIDQKSINFHQVDCFYFAEVSKVQTKSTDGVRCTRMQKGNQYWLSDGRKCVEWQPWSEWDCGSLDW